MQQVSSCRPYISLFVTETLYVMTTAGVKQNHFSCAYIHVELRDTADGKLNVVEPNFEGVSEYLIYVKNISVQIMFI